MRIVIRTVLAGVLVSVVAAITPAWAAMPIVDTDNGWGFSYALEQNGTALYWGKLIQTPQIISNLSLVSVVNDGYWIKNDGTIWSSNGSNGVQIQPTLSGVKQVKEGSAGNFLVLKNDGTVWGWGSNQSGNLGIGHTSYNEGPVQAVGLSNIVSVSTTHNQYDSLSFAIKSDGTVWNWGSNQNGLFGNGQTDSITLYSTPIQQTGLTGFTSIAVGACHVVGLKADGTVWAWGSSYLSCYSYLNPVPAAGTPHALLGNGMTTVSYTPIQVPNLSGIVAIKAIAANSYALKNDGTLWAWGSNDFGALGIGSTITPPNPVQVSGLTNVISFSISSPSGFTSGYGLAEKSDGSVWSWGSGGSLTPSQVLGVNGNGYLYLITPTTADLALTFSATPQPETQPNYGIRYSGTVRNLGPGQATNAKVTFTLSAGMSLVSSLNGNCSATGSTVTCLVGNIWQSNSLHPNTDLAFTFDVATPTAGNYTLTGIASSDLTDPTPNNSVATISAPTSTTFYVSVSNGNNDNDVPTLPEWGMILFAALLIFSQIRQNRKMKV